MANIKIKHDYFWKGTIPTDRNLYQTYGRSINFTYGLILGLIIDKALFYFTKGLSTMIPPFSVLLMNKGQTLFTCRFEKQFNKFFEKILNHIVTK